MLFVSWLRRLCGLRRGSPTRSRVPTARLRVTRLESRRVLNASVLLPSPIQPDQTDSSKGVHDDGHGGVTVDAGHFAGDGAADLFEVRSHGDHVSVSVNGEKVFDGRGADVASLTVKGSADADALRVDLGPAGSPVAHLRFDAGGQTSGADSLTLVGRASEVDHTLHGGGAGDVAAAGLTIDYSGVELLRDSVAAAGRHVDLHEISSARLSAGDHGLALDAGAEHLEFGQSDHLTIALDGGGRNDFELAGLGLHHGDVHIDGDGADDVELSGEADLGGAGLHVEAGAIHVSGAVRTDHGEIGLFATTSLTVDADAVLADDGGSIELDGGEAGHLRVFGTIHVSDADGVGGEVRLLGQRVELLGDARIDADGGHGGGTVLVGGDYQGGNEGVHNALSTTIAPGVFLSADAIEAGDGGRVIVWADGTTRYAGALSAHGGRLGGDGGFAEVSGKGTLAFLGTVDLSAARGDGGTLLLDPRTITVVAANPNLNGDGTTGDDLTAAGDLDQASDQGASTNSVITAGAIKTLLEGGQSLILTAGQRIDIDAAITVTTGTAGLTLVADVVSIDAAVSIGGTFEVRADNIAIGTAGSVATPGTVVFWPQSNDVVISLGGADVVGAAGVAAVLGLTDAELAAVSAGTLTIGSSTTDGIVLADDVTSRATVLKLVSGGDIDTLGLPSPTGPGITAAALEVTANGNVRLDGNNAVGSLAGVNSKSGGVFEFVNRSGDLTLTTVAGVVGVRTTAGTVSITSAGNLTVGADVVSGSRAITLSAVGSIVLESGREIDGGPATVLISGGTLTGSGLVTGNLDIATGSSVAPGSGVGTLTVDGSLTLRTSSTYEADVDDDRANPPATPVAGTDHDVIVVSGATTITAGAILSVSTAGSTRIDPSDAYVLIESAGGVTGTFSGRPEGFRLVGFGGAGVDAVLSYTGGDVTVQVVGPVRLTAPTGGGANDLRLVRNGGLIEFYVAGVLSGTSILAAAESVRVTGADAQDDRLTVDFSGGAFGVDVTFDGGSAGNDTLVLTGGSFTTVTHTFTNANDGRVDLVSTGVAEAVVYTGLEPISDNLSVANRVFRFNGGGETITVTDATAAGATTIASTLGESVTFGVPTGSLTIDAGSGNDVIQITSVDAAFRAAVAIDGGAGNDSVTISAALTLGAGALTGNLDVTAERIVLGANIRTDGGLTGGDVTLTGAVELAAGVTIDTDATAGDGSVTFAGTLNADLEANARSLTLTAGTGDVAFQGAVGGAERLASLTIQSAHDVSFASTVRVVGDLVQTAGSGTTTLNGGAVGGNLSLSAGAVAFAGGTTSVIGTATVTAVTSIRGGTVDAVADLDAGTIALSVTGTTGNLGVGTTGASLEVTTAGVVNVATAAGGGDVFLRGIGDLRLGFVNAGAGDATLAATAAIVDARPGDGAGSVNVAGATAVLTAAAGIGVTDAIDTAVGTLAAATTAGDVKIDEVNGVTIGGTGVTAGGTGAFALHAGGNVVVSAAVRGGSDTTIVSTGGSLSLAADVAAGAANAVRFVAATTVSQTAGRIIATALGVTAGGNVTLSAAGNDVDTFAGRSTAGSVTYIDADGFTVGTVAATADFAGATGVSAAVGDVTLTTMVGGLTIAENVSAAPAGAVRLAAGGAITQTTGVVTAGALGVIAGGAIDLTSPTNDVDVFAARTTGDVAFVDADGFAVRSVAAAAGFGGASGVSAANATLRAAAGDLSLDAAVTVGAGTGAARLAAEAGRVLQVSGDITGQTLAVRAGAGGVGLADAGNDVARFAADSAGGIIYRDATGFAVGSLAGTALFAATGGVRSSNGDVTLRAGAGTLALAADVAAAPAGAVRLVSGGGITQSAGGVSGLALGVRAAGNVALLGPANDVDVFGAVNAAANGAVSFRDVDSLAVGAVTADSQFTAVSGVTTNNGDLLLVTGLGGVAGGGDLAVSAAISAGTGLIRLNADGSATQSAGGSIAAVGLGVRATGPVALLDAGNDVAAFAAATTGGSVAFRDADGLAVGVVAAFADPPLFAETAGVSTVLGGAAGSDVLLVAGLGGAAGNGAVGVDAAVTAGAGIVRIAADGAVTQTAAVAASALGVRTTAGDVTLFTANDFGTFAAGTAGGRVGFSAANAVTVGAVGAFVDPALFADTVGIRTGGGAVAVAAGFVATGQAILSGGGSVVLQADDVAVGAAIDATRSGLVQLTPRADGRGITLGGPGGLSLDAAELNLITARLLAVGGVAVDVTGGGAAASAGRIIVAGAVAPVGVTHLAFLSGADVFGTGAGSISVAGSVVFDVVTGVGGAAGSDGMSLDVTAAGFAGRVRSAGDFRVSSLGGVTVGVPVTVDPIAAAGAVRSGPAGVTTQAGTVAVESRGGDLTVAAALAVRGAASDLILRAVGPGRDLHLNASLASDRAVMLTAGQDVVQASGATAVTAAGVLLTAGRNVGTAAAPIELRAGTVAARSLAGHVFVNEDAAGGGLSVGAVAGVAGIAAPGVVRVTTEGGNLIVSAAIDGVAVRLASGTAGLGSTTVAAGVSAADLVEITSTSSLNITKAGSISGRDVTLTADGSVLHGGRVTARVDLSVTSDSGGINVAGALGGGRDVTLDARGGALSLAAAVTAGGAADMKAAAAVTSTVGGMVTAGRLVIEGAGAVSLGGDIAAAQANVASAGAGVVLSSRTTVAGNFAAGAHGGDVQVAGGVTAGGSLDLGAAGQAVVVLGGRLSASIVRLDAAAVRLSGAVNGLAEVAATARGGDVLVDGAVTSGGSLLLDAQAGGVVVGLPAAVVGGTVGLRAAGDARIDGIVTSALDVSVRSGGQSLINGPVTAGGAVAVASVGPIVLAGGIDAKGATGLASGSEVTTSVGSAIRAGAVDIAAGSTVTVGGTIAAAFDVEITSGTGGVSIGATVSGGRDVAMTAGAGDLMLDANVAAGNVGVYAAARGSVLQPSAGFAVAGGAASFLAAGSVGTPGGAVDLAVGRVAAGAAVGGVWLNQTVAGGPLAVAVLGAQRGVTSPFVVEISTTNGDLVVAAPVKGSAVLLAADRLAGSGDRGHVIFDHGYAETAAARIVGSPPGLAVVSGGVPIARFDLASPFVLNFGVVAGNVADTVDGVLRDRGLTVTVDFVQPGEFGGSQARVQSLTDRAGVIAGGPFGPFTFRYSELFLQEQLILGAAREQLFAITMTAAQDASISIEERLGGTIIADPTQQTATIGNVETSPTKQSLSVPLGVVSPVFAGVEVPGFVQREQPVAPTDPPRIVAVPQVPVLDRVAGDHSAVVAGATAADRPRLFLAWRRPGVAGPPATIEIDLVWLARDYQRQLIGYLKEGRYSFELAEPGSAPRQLGDPFYVRNGLVIDDPSGSAEAPAPSEDIPPDPVDGGVAPPDVGPSPDPATETDDRGEANDSVSDAPQSGALGLATLLLLRHRRRATESRKAAVSPLSRVARAARRVRRAADLPGQERARVSSAFRDRNAGDFDG